MIDDLYYGAGACPCCSGERLYNASAGITFDTQVFEGFLREMYAGFDVSTEIEPSAWREALRIINQGTVQGLAEAEYPDHDKAFLRELKHSNEVFAAFKVHKMGNQMAERMLRADGSLKPFDEWVKDIQGISSHYIGSWLRTEYDMAITRVHQAAEWQEFERNKDVMPNLRWMPTTSPAPENTHRYFWERGVCLPVDDAFWRRHRPGDRWNCKCSLQATDEPVVHPDGLDDTPDTAPQRGLENNPKDGHIFSDKHPYFPTSCASCSFYKAGGRGGAMNWLKRKFENKQKDCYSCPFAQEAVDKAKESRKESIVERAKKILQSDEVYRSDETEHVSALKTKLILREKKPLKRLLAHCMKHTQIDAALDMWAHPERLKFVGESPLGEGKDLDSPKARKNLEKKRKRGVVGYNEYEYEYDGELWIVKLEVHRNGFEQPYYIAKKRAVKKGNEDKSQ